MLHKGRYSRHGFVASRSFVAARAVSLHRGVAALQRNEKMQRPSGGVSLLSATRWLNPPVHATAPAASSARGPAAPRPPPRCGPAPAPPPPPAGRAGGASPP